MITLLFVGDGERDHHMVPDLVRRELGVSIRALTSRWVRLHRRGSATGYRRQLQYVTRRARAVGADGLVATVDRDRASAKERLRELNLGRADDRQSQPPLPTALGEAVPHGEAWLLDDPVAVRQALGLPRDYKIESVRDCSSPKEVFDSLICQCERADESRLELIREIAQQLQPSRSVHARETGLERFLAEVHHELRPLVSGCGANCGCGDTCTIEPFGEE